MLCRYKQKEIISGPKKEVFIYPEFATSPKGGRHKKWRKSTDVQQRLNIINAARKFSRLVSCNFGINDYTVTLEYKNGLRPDEIDQVKKDIVNYLNRLKRIYKKQNIELKYLYVLERGAIKGNLHIHIILTGGVDRNIIEQTWGKGTANTRRLQPEYYDGLDDIADYLQKSPKGTKRWQGSKNLIKPTEPTPIKISAREAREVESNIYNKEYLSKRYPGYRMKDAEPFYNEVNGGVYMIINLIKQEEKRKCLKE